MSISPNSETSINSHTSAADLKDMAGAELGKVAERLEGVASSVLEQGRDASERAQAVAGNIKGAVEQSVKDQPMMTLAVAAIAGFVLGALWKS